jgi:hypothetical protein
MSWSFKKVGTLRDALKAAVQAENSCPQSVRDEICHRIDQTGPFEERGQNLLPAGQAILVDTYGHVAESGEPWRSFDTMVIRVSQIPLINTPLVDVGTGG